MIVDLGVFCIGIKKQQNLLKKVFDKKKIQLKKKNIVCDYCKKKGHGNETYFKLHGVPDWYKEMPGRKVSFATNSAVDMSTGGTSRSGSQMAPKIDIKALIKDEVKKLMASTPQDTPISYGNVVFEYTSNTTHKPGVNMHDRTWLLDSGAS